jgi:hypothetical protein
LTLIKNERWLRESFLEIDNWRERLEDPELHPWSQCLDEAKLSGLFSPSSEVREKFGPRRATPSALSRYWENNYFREQWHTPFVPGPWHDGRRVHPEVWYWKQGHLTNESDGDREFLYLHLMNFKAKRWVDEDLYGTAPTWESLPRIVHFDRRQARDAVVRIDRQGIHLLSAVSDSAQRVAKVGA